MSSRRKEDSKANARVVEIFASHRNEWQQEEKRLLEKINADSEEIARLKETVLELEERARERDEEIEEMTEERMVSKEEEEEEEEEEDGDLVEKKVEMGQKHVEGIGLGLGSGLGCEKIRVPDGGYFEERSGLGGEYSEEMAMMMGVFGQQSHVKKMGFENGREMFSQRSWAADSILSGCWQVRQFFMQFFFSRFLSVLIGDLYFFLGLFAIGFTVRLHGFSISSATFCTKVRRHDFQKLC